MADRGKAKRRAKRARGDGPARTDDAAPAAHAPPVDGGNGPAPPIDMGNGPAPAIGPVGGAAAAAAASTPPVIYVKVTGGVEIPLLKVKGFAGDGLDLKAAVKEEAKPDLDYCSAGRLEFKLPENVPPGTVLKNDQLVKLPAGYGDSEATAILVVAPSRSGACAGTGLCGWCVGRCFLGNGVRVFSCFCCCLGGLHRCLTIRMRASSRLRLLRAHCFALHLLWMDGCIALHCGAGWSVGVPVFAGNVPSILSYS